MEFSTAKDHDNTAVRGRLLFETVYHIGSHIPRQACFDIIEDVKERMKEQAWRAVYGDITAPLNELKFYALRSATPGTEAYVRVLINQLNTLMAFPRLRQSPENPTHE